MADRITGITVEIGGDVTGLSKARSGVNQEINATQRELRDVERLLKLDPEIALNRATDKFTARFAEMERLILADGKSLAEMTLADMDAYWDRVKLSENGRP